MQWNIKLKKKKSTTYLRRLQGIYKSLKTSENYQKYILLLISSNSH